jgi:hypothetical protein
VITPEGEENVASPVDSPQELIANDCGFHCLKTTIPLDCLDQAVNVDLARLYLTANNGSATGWPKSGDSTR